MPGPAWIWNILGSGGWSFKTRNPAVSRRALPSGSDLVFSVEVENDGWRVGTVYVIVRVASTYDQRNIVFDSDAQEDRQRRALRIVDILRRETRKVACAWRTPSNLPPGHYSFRIEAWSPARLFLGHDEELRSRKHCFLDTGWLPGFEVVLPSTSISTTDGRRSPRAFISYAWNGEAHQQWVGDFADELQRNGIDVLIDRHDLLVGEELTRFMERAIQDCDFVVMVCSKAYTDKANGRIGGVGFETVITSAKFLHSKDKRFIIPIVRDNDMPSAEKLPIFLGSLKYVAMDGEDWRAGPMQEIVRRMRA